MKKLFLFAFAIVFTLTTHAQLAFNQPAPLIEHMADVNKEWLNYQGPITAMLEPVSFFNENERIAKHLELVEAHLRTRAPKGLNNEQAQERAEGLDALNLYWREGRFPINLFHSVRQPYFILVYRRASARCAAWVLYHQMGGLVVGLVGAQLCVGHTISSQRYWRIGRFVDDAQVYQSAWC